jgi:hypothetical protein
MMVRNGILEHLLYTKMTFVLSVSEGRGGFEELHLHGFIAV